MADNEMSAMDSLSAKIKSTRAMLDSTNKKIKSTRAELDSAISNSIDCTVVKKSRFEDPVAIFERAFHPGLLETITIGRCEKELQIYNNAELILYTKYIMLSLRLCLLKFENSFTKNIDAKENGIITSK